MKRALLFMTIFLFLVAFVACDPGVADMPDPGRNGNIFNLGSVDKAIDFSTIGKAYYYDVNGVRFPINQYGMLTSLFKNGGYVAPENPAILHVCEAPNYAAQALVSYNFATDYNVRFRLTDSTRVYADGQKSTSPVQQNEPQGFIMAQIFLAGTNPHGAIMVMIFPSNSFPVEIPNVGIWPVYNTLNPNLHENVFVVLNYDGKGAGSLVACANVPGIKAVDPAADPVDTDYYTATMRIWDDATAEHGPSLSVLINGEEVLKYSNSGTAHAVGGKYGVWDTPSDVLYAGQGEKDVRISKNILKINNSKYNEIDKTTPDYFTASNGFNTWNAAWKAMIYKVDPDDPFEDQTNMVAFGTMFQIGKKETAAGNCGVGEPGSSAQKSPEVASINVLPYVTPPAAPAE